MKDYTFRTIIQKDGNGYHGFVPSLPGCHTYGETVEEVRKNIKEAISGWIEAHQDLGWEIPEDSGMEIIETVTLKTAAPEEKFGYA